MAGGRALLRLRQELRRDGREQQQANEHHQLLGAVRQQRGLHPESRGQQARRHAQKRVAERADAAREAVGDLHARVDVLHAHGVDERVGIGLQYAEEEKRQRGEQKVGARKIKDQIERDGRQQHHDQQPLERHLRVPVGPAADDRLREQARKVAQRAEDPGLPGRKAAVEHHGGLVGADGAEHAPEAGLQQNIANHDPFSGRHGGCLRVIHKFKFSNTIIRPGRDKNKWGKARNCAENPEKTLDFLPIIC